MLAKFFQGHMPLVYFIYGLSFFLMGFAVLLQVRRHRKESTLRLAKYMWLLGIFGIIHGLAEWSFMYLMVSHLNQKSQALLLIADTTVLAVSFVFLFLFGLFSLLSRHKAIYKWISLLPIVIFFSWISVMYADVLGYGLGQGKWVAVSRVFIRNSLALPGGLFSSLALYFQYRELKNKVPKDVSRNFLITSLSMAIYGILAGLVVRGHSFLPFTLITEDFFINYTGIPVQIFRAFFSVLLLYYFVRGLDVFEQETKEKLEELTRERLIYKERARIGRDLHDGIIQSIYGVGLRLDNATFLIDESPGQARNQVKETMADLNNIIQDIRQYILDLKPANFEETDLVKGVSILLEKVKANSLMHVDFNVYGQPKEMIPFENCSHFYHILQEVTNNIHKHARATVMEVTLAFKSERLDQRYRDGKCSPPKRPRRASGYKKHERTDKDSWRYSKNKQPA